MNPERIESGEVLFRAVQQHPDLWRGNRPSSLPFRNTAGVSVDRDGERSEADICEFIQSNLSVYRLKAVVSVTAAGCQDIGVLAIPKRGHFFPSTFPHRFKASSSTTLI